jgi:glutamyl-tRNA synthetase
VFDAESLEAVLRPLAVELGLKTGQLFGTLRVAVTGQTAAPPLFQTMAVLGKERCLKRIKAAIDRL